MRCRYGQPIQTPAWQRTMTVLIEPQHRIGRTFAQLWDAANAHLTRRGMRAGHVAHLCLQPDLSRRPLAKWDQRCMAPPSFTSASSSASARRHLPWFHISLSDSSGPCSEGLAPPSRQHWAGKHCSQN